MAAKLQRIERELREVAAIAEDATRTPQRRPRTRERDDPWRLTGAEEATLMSELLALGVSHKTAPLELRERLSLTEGRAVGALRELTAAAGIHEAAAISTCNRTELYLIVSDPVEAESTALGVLTRQAEIRPTELLGHLYSLRASEAARHLLRVTAGLDSMILGEAEIQGQVKRAYELALVEGGDRADPQPPLPRRPLRRRPRPRGDRDQREGRLDPLGRGRAGAAGARRPLRAAGAGRRRRRDRRAGRQGAGRPRRRHRLRRQPPLRPGDRPGPALRRHRRPLRRAARAADRRRHRRLARPTRRTTSSSATGSGR